LELSAHLELAHAWRQITARLRELVDDSTYEIWLRELEPQALQGATLLVAGPPGRRPWIIKRFGRTLETCARAVLGENVTVRFDDEANDGRQVPVMVRPGGATAPATTLNPRYSFSQFVIGEGNRLAHSAALSAAELPGQTFNPLFLYASPGLGKTHLLHAIGNYVLDFGGGASVRYLTAEEFTNDFMEALSSRSVERFKRTHRGVDVLLIDDIQFLANKTKTAEEFFHTFNALHQTGRQMVLTSDRLPRQLAGIHERLRERFEAGLVVDIQPPDYATRVTIVRKRAALDHVQLSEPAVLDLVAERVTDNIRALEGALIRIVAHHSLTGRPIDVAFAAEVLDGIYPRQPTDVLSGEEIRIAVASFFGLSPGELVSASRATRVAWPRQVAIHLTRELTEAPLSTIGEAFGGRNHATVLHACKRVTERIAYDPEAAGDVEHLAAALRARQSDRSY
jgi:chromosomal replication initiator protein